MGGKRKNSPDPNQKLALQKKKKKKKKMRLKTNNGSLYDSGHFGVEGNMCPIIISVQKEENNWAIKKAGKNIESISLILAFKLYS